MKIRSSRISVSIVRAILRRCSTASKRSLLRTIISFFAFFKLLLARYRPLDFVALRQDVWELNEDEYADSFRASPPPSEETPLLQSSSRTKRSKKEAVAQLVPAGDLGYSGSTFFTTPNAKYLIKSLPRRFEHDFFARELLDPYAAHMRRRPHSLLVRITDLVYAPHASLGGMLGTAPTHHIVMENLLFGRDLEPTELEKRRWETYDLKPSDYFFPERDIAGGMLAPDSVLDRLIDEFPGNVRVSHQHKRQLMALLEADSQLLADHNAVDYSLFLVRHPGPNSIPARPAPAPVVLDFFWAKHTLHARSMTGVVKLFNKVAHKGPMTITAEPDEYRKRFLGMVEEMVVGV